MVPKFQVLRFLGLKQYTHAPCRVLYHKNRTQKQLNYNAHGREAKLSFRRVADTP